VTLSLAHIDELERIELQDGFTWRPVRRHFGIRAFGVNVYTPGATGRVIEEHTEREGQEEIYLVLRGRVRFTLGDEEHELGAGQLVFLRDPALRRGGMAVTDDAAVLAIGGKPGEAFEVSGWEYIFPAFPLFAAGRYDEARQMLTEALEERPESPQILYNLACAEALSGETEPALEHLNAAVARDAVFRGHAQDETDFESIRDDPRFPAAESP
jgi:quercetin dioxygenase-like cupin family protein